MIISLEGNLNDDSPDMHTLLRALDDAHRTTSDRKWRLNLRGCRYLGPWAVSVIAAAFDEGRRLEQNPRVVLPDSPPQLQSYCLFSGLAHRVGKGSIPTPEHPESETIPLEAFRTASWDRSNRIIRLLNRHTHLAEDVEDQVRTCVQEVTQNIVDHAESPIGGIMSARYLSDSAEVRVGIVDRGVGILNSLRTKYPDIRTARMALQRVIEGQYSARSRPNNMGLGISNLFELVRHARGRIAVFTGDHFAEIHQPDQPVTFRDLGCVFPGTAVFFSLPVRTM